MTTHSHNDHEYWFAKVDVDVVRDTKLSITTRLVFTVLCTFADKETRISWPSNEAVANYVGISIPTLKRSYKELEDRGVISRTPRFNKNQQLSSYTLIVGRNAPCYRGSGHASDEGGSPMKGGFTSEPVGGSPMSHRTRISERESKDSLRGDSEIAGPSVPKDSFKPKVSPQDQKDSTPQPTPDVVASPKTSAPDQQDSNPKEVHALNDVPAAMRFTAEAFLLKTGRKGFTPEEISAWRELDTHQMPARVQQEITTAIRRFERKDNPLTSLTVSYIASSLRNQPTRNPRTGQSTRKRKAVPVDDHPELAPNEFNMTDEEADAEIARLEAELGIKRND